MFQLGKRQVRACRPSLHQRAIASSPLRRWRGLQSASTVNATVGYVGSTNEASKRESDDALRLIFDSAPFWRDFSSRRTTARPTGLLQNQYLTGPAGFEQFAHASLRKCQTIAMRVLAANTFDDYVRIARDFDRLSDLLCRVIDVADFMRMNHPDRRIQDAAGRAYVLMFDYMNVLNTTPELNEQLKRAASDPAVTAHWTDEEKIAADILIRDFSKSGIHLPQAQRQRFVQLSGEINQVGLDFVQGVEPAKYKVDVPLGRLQGMDPTLVRSIRGLTKASVPIVDPYPAVALATVHDESTRKEIWAASRTTSQAQIRRLEMLLEKRAELAKLTGYESYAHMALAEKMSGSPEAVNKFLTALNSKNKKFVQDDVKKLLALKQRRDPTASQLYPWDKAYFSRMYAMEHDVARKSRMSYLLQSYFSLGTVIQGLSRLYSHLYGIRFVPSETEPGETWNPDVRRLDVLDESNNHIAVLYCDLFTRPNKVPTPTHFTLRCSREILDTEITEWALSESTPSHPNDGMATGRCAGGNSLHQLPVIALVCDFPPPYHGQPALLSEHSLHTLFHEMGHALHSVLGRTNLQTISGTRCAADFAELPSVLNESFALNPSALRLYARHWQTGAPLPEELIAHLDPRRATATSGSSSPYGPAENESQVLMALLDQAYHSPNAQTARFDTTAIYRRVHDAHASLALPPTADVGATSWQGFFTHLFGYGATYYAYLFDRVIAGHLWSRVFAGGDALTRERGERYRDEVLRWGGGRDGWKCIAGAVGGDEGAQLEDGGEEAMELVGGWGIGKG